MTRLPRELILIIQAVLRCSAGIENYCAMRWRRKASPCTRPSGGISITRIGKNIGLGMRRLIRSDLDRVSTTCVSRWVHDSSLGSMFDPSAYADGTDLIGRIQLIALLL